MIQEQNLLLQTLKNHWEPKEDPFTEDPKENPVNEKPKEDTITDTYRQLYQWRCTGASGPSMTFATQINPFWLFGNGIW